MVALCERLYSNNKKETMTYLIVIMGPILDILTGTTRALPLSIGIVVKMIFVIYAGFYLTILSVSKTTRVYTIIVLAFIAVNLINHGFELGFQNLTANTIEIFKTYYFVLMFLWFFDLYRETSFRIKYSDLIFIFLVIFVVFSVSLITKTDYKSYSWASGSSGWYYSSNEISAIIVCLYSMVYFQLFRVRTFWVKIILGSMMVFMSLVIGTRTAYYAFLLISIVFAIYWLVNTIIKTDRRKLLNLLVIILALGLSFAFYSSSPVAVNKITGNHSDSILVAPHVKNLLNTVQKGEQSNNGGASIIEQTSVQSSVNSIPGTQNQLSYIVRDIETSMQLERDEEFLTNLNGILKNRLTFLFEYSRMFINGGVKDILIGMGSNIEFNGKLLQIQVEMDPFTILFRYGFIGSLIFFSPILWFFWKAIKAISMSFWDINSYEFLGMSISIGLFLAISLIVGHVLISPSVSIYGVILMINLLFLIDSKEQKPKVLFISSAGGHFTQLMKLKPLFESVNYLIVTEDISISLSLRDTMNFEYLNYGSRADKNYLFILLKNCFKSIRIFLTFRPDVIISTGTHTAVAMFFIGRLFSCKLIFIESYAKRYSGTISGKILYPICDVFVIQWETLRKDYKNAEYWGWIY